MNLVSELGLDYFNAKYRDSFFKGPTGLTYIVNRATTTDVLAEKIGGSVNKITSSMESVPHEYFDSLSLFAVPELGWRSAGTGKYQVYLSRNGDRLYSRGLSVQGVRVTTSSFTDMVIDEGGVSESYYSKDRILAKMIMEPQYVPFTEGIQLLNSKKIVSFCVSANIAVSPESEDSFAIYFNLRKVGTINREGQITCSIPYIRNYETA